MIHGVVYKNQPLIKIRVGLESNTQELIALVDTGFTSELKLSEEVASQLGLSTTHTEKVILADEKEPTMHL